MEHKKINIVWSTIDVIDRAKEMEVAELSIEEATIILNEIERRHDASIGINWDVISCHIENYLTKINL